MIAWIIRSIHWFLLLLTLAMQVITPTATPIPTVALPTPTHTAMPEVLKNCPNGYRYDADGTESTDFDEWFACALDGRCYCEWPGG